MMYISSSYIFVIESPAEMANRSTQLTKQLYFYHLYQSNQYQTRSTATKSSDGSAKDVHSNSNHNSNDLSRHRSSACQVSNSENNFHLPGMESWQALTSGTEWESNSRLIANKIKKVYLISITLDLISTFIHFSIPPDTIRNYTIKLIHFFLSFSERDDSHQIIYSSSFLPFTLSVHPSQHFSSSSSPRMHSIYTPSIIQFPRVLNVSFISNLPEFQHFISSLYPSDLIITSKRTSTQHFNHTT